MNPQYIFLLEILLLLLQSITTYLLSLALLYSTEHDAKPNQSNSSEQDDDGGSVVQAEDVIVYAGQVPLVEQAGNRAEYEGEHGGGLVTVCHPLTATSSETDHSVNTTLPPHFSMFSSQLPRPCLVAAGRADCTSDQ